MAFQVEIVDKSADRFRVYGAAKLLRSPSQDDILRRADNKLPPFPKGAKVRYDGEDVITSGKVKGDRVTITLPAGETASRVVFYKGPGDDETVVGAVDVNAAGQFEVEFVEPTEAAKAPQIFDAN